MTSLLPALELAQSDDNLPRRPTLAPLLVGPARPSSALRPYSYDGTGLAPRPTASSGVRPSTSRTMSDHTGRTPRHRPPMPDHAAPQPAKDALRSQSRNVDDEEGDTFVALAALHDPSLFGARPLSRSTRPSSPPIVCDLSSRGRQQERLVDEWATRFPSTSRERPASILSRRGVSSWSTGLAVKAEARVGVQVESASSSPVASPGLAPSPTADLATHGRRRSATVSIVATEKPARSPATESLSRFTSRTPPGTSSRAAAPPPHAPELRQFPVKRRHSLLLSPPSTRQSARSAALSPSRPRGAVSPSRSYGSLASLSHLLDRDRCAKASSGPAGDLASEAAASPLSPSMPPSLAPSPRASSGSSTPSPSSFAGSALDLRSLATGSYRALTQALNLSPTSAPGAELAPGEAPAKARWASVRALRVRFRPAALDGADGELNAWVLGMGELALGRSREWDPRGVDLVGGGGRVRSKGGTDSAWPVLSTSMGSPPCVEMVFWDGRTSEVDPTGLAQDEIMRAILVAADAS